MHHFGEDENIDERDDWFYRHGIARVDWKDNALIRYI